MKIITNILENKIDVQKYLKVFFDKGLMEISDNDKINNEDVLIFDIETTGLNVKKTHLYLIGTLIYEDNHWKTVQYFANSISEEKELLEAFNMLCTKYKYIVHFNGNHFDIPYLEEKFKTFSIPSNLTKLISLDIYTLVRNYKEALGLPNCKQKTIETLIELKRLDKYNGGELIFQYFDYLKTSDNVLYDNLLLHNFEDLKGMLELFKVINYIKLIDILKTNDFTLTLNESGCTSSQISFYLKFNNEIDNNDNNYNNDNEKKNDTNLNEIFENNSIFNIASYKITYDSPSNCLILTSLVINEKLYHYFEDTHNYYYIQELDMAIHKSVSKNYNAEQRQKATKANCYVSKIGSFVPLFSSLNNFECFKKTYKDIQSYIMIVDENGNVIVNEKNLIDALSESIKYIP